MWQTTIFPVSVCRNSCRVCPALLYSNPTVYSSFSSTSKSLPCFSSSFLPLNALHLFAVPFFHFSFLSELVKQFLSAHSFHSVFCLSSLISFCYTRGLPGSSDIKGFTLSDFSIPQYYFCIFFFAWCDVEFLPSFHQSALYVQNLSHPPSLVCRSCQVLRCPRHCGLSE